MNRGQRQWRGRRKRTLRRIAHDLRLVAPALALAGCFAISVGVILSAQRAPVAFIDRVADAAQRLELPAVSAAPPALAEATRLASMDSAERALPTGCPTGEHPAVLEQRL
jgi:hypothetical protein